MGRTENSASTSLAPGFRFHPTDEELVSYYLKRKICHKPFRFDAIAEIDIYKVEPWDLPGLSKLKSRDLEWYFFSGLDRKYGNGSRTNRATLEGYWKTTGKDRSVHHRSRLVGMKKTLVYHLGRAPYGKRTNWVMHEYKLVDEAMEKAGYSLEGVVLCRIFQKSGSGPKNGEKYGAPYVEEEWENDDALAMVPGDMSFEEQSGSDEAFIEQNDLHQNHNLQLPGDASFPCNQYQEDNTIYVEDIRDIIGNDEIITREGEYDSGLKALDDDKFFDLPVQDNYTVDMSRNDHISQPNNVPNELSTNCMSNGTSSDTVGDFSFDDGLFLDAIDFLDTTDENALDFGTHGLHMEDDIDIAQYLSFDSAPGVMGIDASQTLFTNENWDNATWQLPSSKQELLQPSVDYSASSSQQVLDVPTSEPSEPDMQYPYLGKAGRLLGNIPAPPAFASEFPSKDLAVQLNAVQSSSSVRVTAGMIRINDMTIGGSRLQLSFDKTGNVNVLLSFDLPPDVSLSRVGLFDSLTGMLSSKMATGWSRWMFVCVFVFAISLKVGSCIYSK